MSVEKRMSPHADLLKMRGAKLERCIDLCYDCLESKYCPKHPFRRPMNFGVRCFVDDDFELVDVDSIKEFTTDVELTDELIDASSRSDSMKDNRLIPDLRRRRSDSPSEHSGIESGYEEISQTDVPRKKFARFREKKYLCDICDAAFTLKQNVACDIFLFHIQPDGTMRKTEKKAFKCKECGQIFRTPNSASVHYKKKHKKTASKPPSDCDMCGKSFASAFQLREHIVIQHLKERNFECEHCNQKFGRRGGLRRHVQMVHQNHLHKCPYNECDHPGYKCSKALTAHIRSVHTNVRPYVCDDCGKAFVRRNDLKMHQLTHSKQMLFPCQCGSRFRRQIYLRKHQKNCISSDRYGIDDASPSDEKDDSDETMSNQDSM